MTETRIQFLGATGTVTGSKYLVRHGNFTLMVDCGLFQGWKQLRLRNREPLPIAPDRIDAVVLTHAHIDHSGYLPLLVKQGFDGPVYCSHGTAELCGVLLPDSGHLQEEDAAYANRHGFSRHNPALPLYTVEDAKHSLKKLRPLVVHQRKELAPGLVLELRHGGHILGATQVVLHIDGKRLVFSGDLGRPHDVIMNPPDILQAADWLVIESTYGNRSHDPEDPRIKLARVICDTARRGGVVVVPTFAVGRAQTLMYLIDEMMHEGSIPPLPVFLDSPMAVDATEIFCAHAGEHRLGRKSCTRMAQTTHLVRSMDESRAVSQRHGPMIILAASGMATGGRVLHHLKERAPDSRNTILFSGFQAGGTRGAAMLEGATSIKIHGEWVPVRAHVDSLSNLSAHVDAREMLQWLQTLKTPPAKTFIVHGEADAADALRQRIEHELGWKTEVPFYLEETELS